MECGRKNILFILCIFLMIIWIDWSYLGIQKSMISTPIRGLSEPRKYVFFDLGVNNGDSLLKFFDMENRGMVGGQLSYSSYGDEAKSARWIVHAFEANPHFNEILTKITNDLSKSHIVNMYKETAAWIYDGKITFYLDTVNEANNFWGSSLDKNHKDVVNSNFKNVTVACIDISSLIKQYTVDDLIVVKIDIEGAEYELMLDFILKDALRYIDYIAVEFHPTQSKFSSVEDLFQAIFKKYNLKFVNWN